MTVELLWFLSTALPFSVLYQCTKLHLIFPLVVLELCFRQESFGDKKVWTRTDGQTNSPITICLTQGTWNPPTRNESQNPCKYNTINCNILLWLTSTIFHKQHIIYRTGTAEQGS